jgi:competence protein ComEA
VLPNLKPFFQFTPNERRGVIVLLVLIVVAFAIRISIPYFKTELQGSQISHEWLETIQKSTSEKGVKKKNTIENPVVNADIIINPNTASMQHLKEVGFNDFVAKNIIKYRKAGGKYYSKTDLLRVYGIDSVHVEHIQKQLVFAKKSTGQEITGFSSETIELNSADTNQLMQIPCIGSVLSKRIINFRGQLGGFYSVNQLNEVYGIDSVCFTRLKQRTYVDTLAYNKIGLNTATEEELKQHPYISSFQAKAILKYRELMHPFSSKSELRKNHLLSEAEYQKVEKYLVIN